MSVKQVVHWPWGFCEKPRSLQAPKPHTQCCLCGKLSAACQVITDSWAGAADAPSSQCRWMSDCGAAGNYSGLREHSSRWVQFNFILKRLWGFKYLFPGTLLGIELNGIRTLGVKLLGTRSSFYVTLRSSFYELSDYVWVWIQWKESLTLKRHVFPLSAQSYKTGIILELKEKK